MPSLRIEPAREGDIPVVLSLIREMADYERVADVLEVNEERLREFVFCARPYAEILIGYWGERAVSYAIILPKFYSYTGRPHLYLEDIYVQPRMRGKGIGRALMAHLARLAVERGCAYLEWNVLEWNQPAVAFYQKLGARRVEGRSYFYLDRPALESLAGQVAAEADGIMLK